MRNSKCWLETTQDSGMTGKNKFQAIDTWLPDTMLRQEEEIEDTNIKTRNLLIVYGGCHIKPSTSQGKYQNKYPGWNNEDPLVPYVISLGACPDVAWHAYKLVRIIQTADYHFEVLECKMLNCLISHVIFFLFDLWDVFEISCVIIFIPIK